ncbi:hypothetical protein ACQQ2Q_00525 [Agrobacterium sp. ES01]|uniref:hypothetical protein n=1 Tax=Agrobacterium sp. ES01 TaxID=3420714 RepID=UPI003D0F7BF9
MFKFVFRLLALVPMVLVGWGVVESAITLYRSGVAYGLVDPVGLAQYRLYAAGPQRFVEEIEKAIDAGDYDYAESLYALGIAYGHDLPPDLEEKAKATWARRAGVGSLRAARGFIFGSVETGEELAGTLVSDLVGVGDLRDFSVQGFNYVSGRDYDVLLLGFSAVGLGLTAASYGSFGLAAPADTGVSLVKNAYRARRLSKPLTAYFAKTARRLIKPSVLKTELKVSSEGAAGIARLEKAAFKSVDKTAARILMKDVEVLGDMRKTSGIRAPLAALAIADGPKDLRKLSRVSAHFGAKGAVVMKFLGRSVIRLGYGVAEIASAAISLILMLSMALIRLPARLLLGRLFSRWHAAALVFRTLRPILRAW